MVDLLVLRWVKEVVEGGPGGDDQRIGGLIDEDVIR
jgi:methylglyoxal synthase